jgi:RNA polymerase sigma-70 factor (ECF subfamily)
MWSLKCMVMFKQIESEDQLMSAAEMALNRMAMLDEDIEIVRRVKSGDPDSFEPLVEKYQSFVFGVIRSLIYDPDLEQDLAQEAFINAFRGIHRFREQSGFKTWLYRITYNVCLNYLRKKKSDRITDDEINLGVISDSAKSPDRAYETGQIRNMILKIMNELKPKYRSILHLYYFEDMQYEEISHLTGLPLGTVKSHLHRARDQVKKALEQSGWLTGGVN